MINSITNIIEQLNTEYIFADIYLAKISQMLTL